MKESSKIVYLDNAATSFPKPESVYEAVLKTMREECGNPGRAGHRLSLSAGRNVNEARVLCARLFNAQSPENIVFTPNTTVALNIAIKGIVEPGDHVITSSLEHNSVSRPLHYLEQAGVRVTKLPTDLRYGLSAGDIEKAVTPDTKLVVCTHVSNVTGTINDIASIGAFCGSKGIHLLVDAAQSAGSRAIDVQNTRVDMLAFPGHKGLLGPQGTGGLYIRPGLELKTIIQGGTGSESESLSQPEIMPDRFVS
jgi:selenocysteine lyase/cysteine desulfurase